MLSLIGAILSVTAPFFALIACGYAARRSGVMVDGSARVLNDFVLFFALPALLIRTIAGLPVSSLLNVDFAILWGGVALAMFAIVALAASAVFREEGRSAVVEAAIATHGNVGYLGLTLVIGLLGERVAALVSMAIIIDMALIIPLTIAMVSLFAGTGNASIARVAQALRQALLNPFLASIAAGVFLSALEFSPPAVVDSFMKTLGAAAVPTALFAIGVSLHGRSIGEDWRRLSTLVTLKLLIHPLAILTIGLFLMGLDDGLVAAAVLLAALPTANNVFMLAMRYDAHPQVVSGAIVASTVLAVLTFNAWAMMVSGW